MERERFSAFDICTDSETQVVSFSKANELQDSSHYLAPDAITPQSYLQTTCDGIVSDRFKNIYS